MKKEIIAAIGLFTAATGAMAQNVEWISSTSEALWVSQHAVALACQGDYQPFDLEVKLDGREQTIEGWGGCFNELGWSALQAASSGDRQEVLRQLFAPGVGLNLTICRMPIGASDYAKNWYSLDDTPGDFALAHFDLERDRTLLLPYIRSAMNFQPN